MMAGSCVAYARSIQELREDLLRVRPTVLISVPRIYEKAYARIQEKLVEEGKVAQTLFRRAVDIGWARFLTEQENLIGIEPRTHDLPRLSVTNRQMKGTFVLSMALIPGILALVGTAVWWRQR